LAIHTAVGAFELATAARIVFGSGKSDGVGELAAEFGGRAFLVTGGSSADESGLAARITASLADAGCAVTRFRVEHEPTVSLVDRAVESARDVDADVVVAVGGGSVVDTGKAVSGLIRNEGGVIDYLEGVGNKVIDGHVVPMIAMPTTAGTGSEVTKNAVITADDGSFKKSMRSPHLIPCVALVDPLLTLSAPRTVTTYAGLDALTQLIESFTSNGSSVLTDALAETGIELAGRSLRRAYDDGTDTDARHDMALASLLGGVCLANAGLGAAHGIVAPLGSMHGVPHGAGCAALLPSVVEMNVRRLAAFDSPLLTKYERVGALLGAASLDELPCILREMVASMHVPTLGTYGLNEGGVDAVVAGSHGSSMRYNPVELRDAEIREIIVDAL
jgi:alcohol dehydrogenase class IV